jgi:hypothetical protein
MCPDENEAHFTVKIAGSAVEIRSEERVYAHCSERNHHVCVTQDSHRRVHADAPIWRASGPSCHAPECPVRNISRAASTDVYRLSSVAHTWAR